MTAARHTEDVLDADWISTREAFAELKDEWNELLKESNSDTLFLTWEWLYTWWVHLSGDRTMSIITVRRNGRLIGVAPLAIRPANLLRLLPFRAMEFLGSGNVGSDYLDVIARSGEESQVMAHVWRLLDKCDMGLELQSISNSSVLMTDFSRKRDSSGWRNATVKTGCISRINLADHDWESYMAGQSKSHRTKYGRVSRKIQKSFRVRFEPVETEEQRSGALQQLMSLHMKRWDSKGGSNAFDAQALQSFHEAFSAIALNNGWLRLSVLWLDDKPAASVYGFAYNKVFYYYQAGFDTEFYPYSPGFHLLGMTINYALDEGLTMYDFLRGEESYKASWKNETTELGNQEFYPARWRGQLRRQAALLRGGFKRLVWKAVPEKLKT